MEEALYQLGQILWAQSWQLTALVLLIALSVKLCAGRRPHLAHALWLIVLLKCITPPVLSSPSGIFCWAQKLVPEHADWQTERLVLPKDISADGSEQIEPAQRSISPAHRSKPLPPLAAGAPVEGIARDVSMPSTTAATRNSDPDLSEARSSGPSQLLLDGLIVWLLGVSLVAATAALRLFLYIRRIRCTALVNPAAYEQYLSRLARRLKVKSKVRLLITSSRVGPAVIGLLRPTIVLPEIVLRGKNLRDLEPILAHELIHIRRGDLWSGMLQMVCQALWWFHPLVWWTTRIISREAERCCDEEVIGGLGCHPAHYAKNLLDVLELKQTFRPAPVFPGVRTVELTSKRLERIMALGNGCRKRTPWWCWLIMAAVALAVLPGGRVGVAEEKILAASQMDENDPVVTRQYEVDDILRLIEQEHDCDRKTANKILVGLTGFAPAAVGGDEQARGCRISGGQLLVTARRDGQRRMMNMLANVRKYGVAQVEVHVWLAHGPAEIIHAIVPKTLIEGDSQVSYQVVGQMQADEIINRLQNHARTNLISAPKFRVMSGRTASAEMTTDPQRSRRERREEGKTAESIVKRGAAIEIQPVARADGKLWLRQCHLRLSKTLSTGTSSVGHRHGKGSVEATHVMATLLDASGVELAPEETLVVMGVAAPDEGQKDQTLLAILRAHRVRVTTNERLDGHTLTYPTQGTGHSPGGHVQSTNPAQPDDASPSLPPLWEMSLQEAIALGLHNAEVMRSFDLVVSTSEERPHELLVTRRDETDDALIQDTVAKLVSEIEQAYWDLWLAYQKLEEIESARDQALRVWREIKSIGNRDNLPQEKAAREQYFHFVAQREAALLDVFDGEACVRFVAGLASDEKLIGPTTDPAEEKYDFQWEEIVTEAMNRSKDVVKQKELVSRLEARIQEVSNDQSRRPNRTLALLRNMERSLASEREELQQIREQSIEKLRTALSDYGTAYTAMKIYANRAAAVATELELLHKTERSNVQILLDAQRRHTQSVLELDRFLAAMAQRATDLQHLKGTLLDYHDISISDE